MIAPLRAALIDVGATLWPNWELRETDEREMVSRIIGVLDRLSYGDALDLANRSEERLRAQGGRDAPDAEIAQVLAAMGLPADPTTARDVRRAMCVPAFGHIEPVPGTREFLAAARHAGLAVVLVSNTRLRDRAAYRQDFVGHDLDGYITDYVTSVEVGRRKPAPAMFEAAMAAAGVPAPACVMVGDHLRDDIAPALGLGMRALLVNVHGYPESEVPATADVIPSLASAAAALHTLVQGGTVRRFGKDEP
jgi:FMN phosphatase YigB (HAD superfamily)